MQALLRLSLRDNPGAPRRYRPDTYSLEESHADFYTSRAPGLLETGLSYHTLRRRDSNPRRAAYEAGLVPNSSPLRYKYCITLSRPVSSVVSQGIEPHQHVYKTCVLTSKRRDHVVRPGPDLAGFGVSCVRAPQEFNSSLPGHIGLLLGFPGLPPSAVPESNRSQVGCSHPRPRRETAHVPDPDASGFGLDQQPSG